MEPTKSSAGERNDKVAEKWNGFMKEYEGVTATEHKKQSKPTLVLSVIGNSNTFVPKQWPKNVFQTALIEAAKSEEGTWILYRDRTDGVSKIIKEAYQHYEAMEFGTETKAVSDPTRRIKLISTIDEKDVGKEKPTFPDFETFVSTQTVFYFGPDLKFEIPIPVVVIVCEGDVQTIFHISEALRNQLPVIIMKGSGMAADLVLDYLDIFGQNVIQKKYSHFFGAEFEEDINKNLEYIKQNRKLVWEFDLHKDDPLMLSSIVGEAVVNCWSMKNILQSYLENPPKKTIKDDSRNGSISQKTTELFEGLNWGTRSYKTNPKFSTSTSLPLYLYLGYHILQENEEFMKECGKVLLVEALRANRCEYVSVLMDQGVKIDSRDLYELYRKPSKDEEILVKLSLRKEFLRGTMNGNSKCEKQGTCNVEALRQVCRDILHYEEFDSKEGKSDVSIGDILLWAIVFNRRELAEICWLRGKDQLLTGLVCSAVLKELSNRASVDQEGDLAFALEEHSTIFEQRCTSILDIMNAENSDETIGLLTTNSSVWGIYSSPLTFAHEKLMYDVVAHTCSKKYMKKELYNNLATDMEPFLISFVTNPGSFICAPMTRYMCHFLIFLMVLIMYSGFVLTSISTEYYVQGPGRFFEYFVYIWRLGDLLEELIGYCSNAKCIKYCKKEEARSHLLFRFRTINYINDFWNCLDLLSYIIIVIAMLLRHLGQDELQIYARNMFAFSLLILYLRFLEAFLFLELTGTPVIMLIEMLKDLRKYFHIVLTLVLGVGIYYHANLWPDHQALWSGGLTRWRIWTIIFYPYWQIYGEANLETLTGSDQDNCSNDRSVWESDPSTKRCPEEDWTVPVIAGLYMIVVNLLLVNIVIADFSYTYEFIHTNSEKLWHYHLCTVIKDYSQRIPSPINLIGRPIQLIIHLRNHCLCNRKVDDSSHQTMKKEQKAKKKFQQTFQKIVALRNHKEP